MEKKILMAASECESFAKTGGLGDVIAGLSASLASSGHEVTVFLPYYRTIKNNFELDELAGTEVEIEMGSKILKGTFLNLKTDGNFQVICLENDDLYDRDQLYVDKQNGADYSDNDLRFGFFSRAIIEYCKKKKYRPHIIHAHDWQTGLIPALVHFDKDNFFKKSAAVFTIHNLAFQGLFEKEKLNLFGLPAESYLEDGLYFFDKISLLKAGIAYADEIVTVSEKYALEIQSKELGFGMAEILCKRAGVLHGIINGVDYSVWNPKDDPRIIANYCEEDLSGKERCKEDLIDEFNLSKRAIKGPIFGIVSRLTQQKGLDLVVKIVPDILAHGGSVVVLGEGDAEIEKQLNGLMEEFSGKFSVKVIYDDVIAHKIEAGADFFLMPSQFEPCGLNQMYSLKYATPPIVHAVGGLDDTVSEFYQKSGRGTGFKFNDYTPEAFLKAVAKSFDIYANPKWMEQIRLNCMAKDFSWQKQSKKYVKVYNSSLKSKKESL